MTQQQLETNQLINANGWNPANETWTYASADDPTYTFTISAFDATTKYSVGMKIKLTQSTGGTKYAFITKVVFDDPGSTITAYFGTDYNLENEAITLPYYSMLKAPFGFPLDPDKWTEEFTDTASRIQAVPTIDVWYNIGTSVLSVPIGLWNLGYFVNIALIDASSSEWYMATTLSTANNSQSDLYYSARVMVLSTRFNMGMSKNKYVLVASKTSYYLNARSLAASLDNMYFRGDVGTTSIRAVCAYL